MVLLSEMVLERWLGDLSLVIRVLVSLTSCCARCARWEFALKFSSLSYVMIDKVETIAVVSSLGSS